MSIDILFYAKSTDWISILYAYTISMRHPRSGLMFPRRVTAIFTSSLIACALFWAYSCLNSVLIDQPAQCEITQSKTLKLNTNFGIENTSNGLSKAPHTPPRSTNYTIRIYIPLRKPYLSAAQGKCFGLRNH